MKSLRLVDDSHDVQAGDGPGVLGRLALGVVEVGGHRDHGIRHFLAQVGLGHLLHLGEHHRGDLLRRECGRLALDADLHVWLVVLLDHLERIELYVLLDGAVVVHPADQPFHVENGVLRV